MDHQKESLKNLVEAGLTEHASNALRSHNANVGNEGRLGAMFVLKSVAEMATKYKEELYRTSGFDRQEIDDMVDHVSEKVLEKFLEK